MTWTLKDPFHRSTECGTVTEPSNCNVHVMRTLFLPTPNKCSVSKSSLKRPASGVRFQFKDSGLLPRSHLLVVLLLGNQYSLFQRLQHNSETFSPPYTTYRSKTSVKGSQTSAVRTKTHDSRVCLSRDPSLLSTVGLVLVHSKTRCMSTSVVVVTTAQKHRFHSSNLHLLVP